MNELALFEGKEVMILTKEDVNFEFKGDFLIRAKDVSSILGYSQTNDFVSLIKSKYVYKVKNSDLAKSQNRKLNNAGEVFISSFGIFQGLSNSTMPKAESFQDWLYEDALPTIQKHGAYATPQTIDNIINDPEFGIKLLETIKKEREEKEAIQLDSLKKDEVIQELKPKADYTDLILKNKGLVTITQIAKDYGMTAKEMNEYLRELKIQFKQSGQWLLYRKYDNKGYVHSETHNFTRTDGRPDVSMTTKWTQKGRLFIYELLKEQGIVPVIEREEDTKVYKLKVKKPTSKLPLKSEQ